MEQNNLVVVSYYIPPMDHIACMRVGGLCNYFSEQGWNVTALTATHPSHSDVPYDVIESGTSDTLTKYVEKKLQEETNKSKKEKVSNKSSHKKKALKYIRDNFLFFPDRKKGWKSPAVEAGKNIIESTNADCVMSSSGPFTAHRIAAEITKEYDLPWVADFRDRWSQNPFKKRTQYEGLQKK